MVTVVKPDRSVRMCIQPKYLKETIEREHSPMKTIGKVAADMQEANVFSTIDFLQLK